jgi:PPP family 3-phenylpropionic acid transporter
MLIFYLMQTFIQPLNGSIASYFQIAMRNKGWSYSLVGVVTALGQITTIVGPLFVALAAERRGKEKKALIICTLLSLAFHIPFFLAGNALVTGFCYVVSCAFMWSINPVSDGLITKNCIGTNTEYGNIRACGTMGYVVFMLLFSITGFPSNTSNLQMMLNNAFFSIVVLVLICFAPSKSIASFSDDETGKIFSKSRFGKEFYIFIAFVAISRVSMAAIDKMLASYMVEEMGLGRWFTAFIALGAFSEFFFMIGGTIILKKGKMSPYAMLMLSAATVIIRLLGYVATKNIIVFGLCQLLHGTVFAFCHVASVRWISERVDSKHYSLALTIYHSVALNLPVLLGSLAGGFIVDGLGYRALFLIYTLFPLASMIFGFVNRKNLVTQ